MNRRARKDIVVSDQGTLVLMKPTSPAGKWWLNKHLDPDAQKLGETVVIEHRYALDIIRGAQSDGLRLVLNGGRSS